MDFFKDINDIRASFKKFASLLPPDGTLVINSGIEAYKELTEGLKCRVVTFGKDEGSDYRATDISFDDRGLCSYTLHRKNVNGEETEKIKLFVPGEHNVYNSLAAIAAADAAGARQHGQRGSRASAPLNRRAHAAHLGRGRHGDAPVDGKAHGAENPGRGAGLLARLRPFRLSGPLCRFQDRDGAVSGLTEG